MIMAYSNEDIAQRAYSDIANYPARYTVKNEVEALAKLSNAYNVYRQKSDIYRPIYEEYNEYVDIIKNTSGYTSQGIEQISTAIRQRDRLQPYLDEALENRQNAEVYVYAWGLVLDKLRGQEDNALYSSYSTNFNRFVKEAQNYVNTAANQPVTQSKSFNKKYLYVAIAAGLLLLLYGEN